MRKLNVVIVEGKMASDPETKYLPSGMSLTKFRIGIDRSYKKGEEWVKKTVFKECQMWGKDGEAVAESRRKGDFVVVTGATDGDEWEKDGKKQSKDFIAADSCKHLHNPFGDKDGESGTSGRSGRVHAGNYKQEEGGASTDLEFDRHLGEVADDSDSLDF